MIVAVVLTFATVFSVVLGVFLLVVAKRHSATSVLKRRVSDLAGETVHEIEHATLLREDMERDRLLSQLPVVHSLAKLVLLSGVRIRPWQFLLLVIVVFWGGFSACFLLTRNILFAFCGGVLAAIAPFAFLQLSKRQREAKFDEQLPDALVMMARSLRAGHSLAAAVELIGEELPEPTSGLFRAAYEQQQLGMRMAEALTRMRSRIESKDLIFFTTIVRINSESGGNLSEILEKLAETIRTRLQIRRQVQVYTAEGRLSGYILMALPVFVFIVLHLKNPEYMNVFFTERLCQKVLLGACLAQAVGFLMIRKIIDIRI